VAVFSAAAGEREPRNRSDACKRFAAKAEACNALEILERGDFARGVAREREKKIVSRNAATVVAHTDRARTAGRELHRDLTRAGVETVLEQLLQCRSRTLDDFTRGDLIDQELG
jgi:hypothetical protein